MEEMIIDRLRAIVGPSNITTEYEDLLCYAYDATFRESLPAVVVKPRSTEEISLIMRLANEYKIPVVPRGAGTGLSGGSVPFKGGICLVLTRLNRILSIDKENRVAVVEPGVITDDFHAVTEQMGLFYPPDPASGKTSTMGGNIAECAGGARGVKYGVTKDYVLGLEVVLPQGDVITVGNPIDGETGDYDYPLLFTGSEGTLGIITKIMVRLIPLPPYKETVLAIYDQLEAAGETVSTMIKQGVIPTTLEIADHATINAVENYLAIGLPTDAQAFLLIEVDGIKDEVVRQIAIVEETCRRFGAVSIKVARTKEEIDKLWLARRSISGACGKISPTKISEDATVPRSKIPEMIKKVREIAEKYGIKMVIFGHAGDGNLHPNVLTDKRNKEEMARVEEAVAELFQATVEMGGTLSGEHGIGYMKAPFLKWETGETGYQVMKAIKKQLDPHNILNPGKMFTD